jgi:hypothetical protein
MNKALVLSSTLVEKLFDVDTCGSTGTKAMYKLAAGFTYAVDLLLVVIKLRLKAKNYYSHTIKLFFRLLLSFQTFQG